MIIHFLFKNHYYNFSFSDRIVFMGINYTGIGVLWKKIGSCIQVNNYY